MSSFAASRTAGLQAAGAALLAALAGGYSIAFWVGAAGALGGAILGGVGLRQRADAAPIALNTAAATGIGSTAP